MFEPVKKIFEGGLSIEIIGQPKGQVGINWLFVNVSLPIWIGIFIAPLNLYCCGAGSGQFEVISLPGWIRLNGDGNVTGTVFSDAAG